MQEAEAREKLLQGQLDDITTKFNRLMAADGSKKPGVCLRVCVCVCLLSGYGLAGGLYTPLRSICVKYV